MSSSDSIRDSMEAWIRSKIQYHQTELMRLQALIQEYQSSASQKSLNLAPANRVRPHGKPPSFIEAVRSVLKDGESLPSREIADRLKSTGYKSRTKPDAYYPTIYNQLVWWDKKGEGVVKVGDRATGVLFRRK